MDWAKAGSEGSFEQLKYAVLLYWYIRRDRLPDFGDTSKGQIDSRKLKLSR